MEARLKKMIENQQQQINSQNKIIEQQQQLIDTNSTKIEAMSKKIIILEGKLIIEESKWAVSNHVNEVLNKKIDELNQYSRRSCMVVDGIPIEEQANIAKIISSKLDIEEDVVAKNIDKYHPIGPVKSPKSYKTQSMIIKFRTHHYREMIYSKRKSMKIDAVKIKFRVSLTKRRQDLLKQATDFCDPDKLDHNNNLDFAFADTLGNCKIKFKKRVNNKLFADFNDEIELANIIGLDAKEDGEPNATAGQ